MGSFICNKCGFIWDEMESSPSAWKILEWEDKPQTNKQTNRYIDYYEIFLIYLLFKLSVIFDDVKPQKK